MTRAGRRLAVAAALALAAFLSGFVVFAIAVARFAPASSVQADGIVVLTGGKHRLSVAAALLSARRGKRLLISGANPIATRHDLFQHSGLSADVFKCCVASAMTRTKPAACVRDQGLGKGQPLLAADYRDVELSHCRAA